jgi:2-oxoglutarate dehydrogenase complex dehydrogenase (E1) component-like enzyme
MTHRIVVNVQTGETTQVEYTAEEQAVHDAAVAAQQAEAAAAEAQAQAQAQAQAEQPTPEQGATDASQT